MGTIARTAKAGGGTNFNSGQLIDPTEVNTDFNTAYTLLNGNLDDDNLRTATMPGQKSFRFTEVTDPSTPTANDLLLYAKDSGGGITRLYTKDGSANVASVGYERIAGTGTALGYVPAVISTVITSVGTDANTNEKLLHQHSILANTLTATGDALHLVAHGLFASNGNNKTIRVKLITSLTKVEVTSAVSGAMWHADLWFYMAGGASLNTHGVLVVGPGGSTYGAASSHIHAYGINDAVTFSSTWQIGIYGQNGTASASDVNCRFSKVTYYPLS